jgi:hypothetical protein
MAVPGKNSQVKPKATQKSTTVNPKESKASKKKVQPVKIPKDECKQPINSIANEVSIVAASNINALPEFAQAVWGASFLPTLYDCLRCLANPFIINHDMVKAIQEVVDVEYPNSIYQVCINDRIFTMVCQVNLSLFMCTSTERHICS